MSRKNDRRDRRSNFCVESLEGRKLMSVCSLLKLASSSHGGAAAVIHHPKQIEIVSLDYGTTTNAVGATPAK
jgi:hypothetical protein